MRKLYLDNIRWITVILVVLYHVIYIFNGIITDGVVGPFHPMQYQDGIQYFLYPWFMVLLFTVSGASARYALEKQSDKEFIISRTRKLLVPSTIGLLSFHWFMGYINMSIAGAFASIPSDIPGIMLYLIMSISGTGVLWFIQMLWIFSLLLVLFHKCEKGTLCNRCKGTKPMVLLLMAIPLWLSAQVLNTPVISVYRFGIYGLAFFLGYLLFSHEEVVERLSRVWLPLTIGALVLGVGYTIYYFGENYAVSPVVNSPFSILYCWTAVLAIFAVMKRFGDRTFPLAHWMVRHSFGLYIFHYLPLSAVALWICRGNNLAPFPSYLITGAAAFLGGWGLYEIISRTPVLRWCVLGIRKR